MSVAIKGHYREGRHCFHTGLRIPGEKRSPEDMVLLPLNASFLLQLLSLPSPSTSASASSSPNGKTKETGVKHSFFECMWSVCSSVI